MINSIAWDITAKCNFKCPHCYYATSTTEMDEITLSQAKNFLDQVAQNGIRTIGITGGEPFLCKFLLIILSYGKNLGLKFTIATNGSIPDYSLLKNCVENNLVSIQVSLDGSIPKTNTLIRANSDKNFYDAIKMLRISRDLGLYVTMGVLLHKETIENFDDFLNLTDALGINCLRYSLFIPNGIQNSLVKTIQPSKSQLNSFLNKVVLQKTKVRILLDCPMGAMNINNKHDCHAGIGTLYINAYGDVYPCSTLYFDQFKLGNITKEPLSEIIKKAAENFPYYIKKENKKGKCNTCHNDNCFGGCPGLLYACFNNLHYSYPFLCKSSLIQN